MNKELLVSPEEIEKKIQWAAKQLNLLFVNENDPVCVIGILKGCICFVADLIRHLEFPFSIDFIFASSYGNQGVIRGEVLLSGIEKIDVKRKNILLVDDICDSGNTLITLRNNLLKKHPKRITTIVLLKKHVSWSPAFTPDISCFEIPNCFVVGYGLDYKESFRGLKGIYQLQV